MARLSSTLFVLVLIAWDVGRAQQDGERDTVGSKRVVDLPSCWDWFAAKGWLPRDQSASEFIDLHSYIRNFQRFAGLPVSGNLDKATMDKMNSPRCGNPDFGPEGFTMTATRRKRYTTLGRPWSQNHITWFLAGTTPDLSRSTILREMKAAFDHWQEVSALTFEQVFSSDADIIINFNRLAHGDGNAFDGTGMTLAHAFAPGRGIGGDMHFDDDETFTASTGINLRQVAVHEIGHSLGLGHSSDNNAIMAPFYTYRRNFALGTDDIAGIRMLYGRPTSRATRPPMKTEAPTRPTVTTTTPPRTVNPVFCNGEFDAATETHDGAVHLFQGKEVFKVKVAADGRSIEVEPGYPRKISDELPGAPNFIDAAFLWTASSRSHYLFIFKGYRYWRYYNGRPSSGYPRPISDWGLPGNIDGAFRWPANDKIYFFKGNQYYRYNSMTSNIDSGYPKSMGAWTGIRPSVSAVLNYGSQSFFFNGQYFQEFRTSSYSASENYQTANFWLGCQTAGLRDFGETTAMVTTEEMTTMSGVVGTVPGIFVVMVTSLLSVLVTLWT